MLVRTVEKDFDSLDTVTSPRCVHSVTVFEASVTEADVFYRPTQGKDAWKFTLSSLYAGFFYHKHNLAQISIHYPVQNVCML